MQIRKLSALIGLILAIFVTLLPGQTQRGQGAVTVQRDNGIEFTLYRESHALVIGASDYTAGWEKLPGVKEDVVEVGRALKNDGFQVQTLLNPTRAQLIQGLNEFVDDYGFRTDNRLLVYFAGHGHTLKAPDGRNLGFIVPVDAPDPRKDLEGFNRKAYGMIEVYNLAKRIQAKHALFIFDSCFSGSLFRYRDLNSSVSPIPVSKAILDLAQPVRQFITAGTEGQRVPDESIFRKSFIRGLNGEADSNHDGVITGSELSAYLHDTVTNYTNGNQTPRGEKIDDVDLSVGDFIFVVPHDRSSRVTTSGLIEEGLAYLAKADFDEAIRKANQIIAADSNEAWGYAIRGTANSLKNNNDASATADLQTAERLNDNLAIVHARLGFIYNGQGKTTLAEENSNRAIGLAGDDRFDLFAKGLSYSTVRKLDNAIATLSKVLDLNPSFTIAYNYRGNAYLDKGEYDNAISDYNKAIELSPRYTSPYSNRGIAYMNKGEYDRAISNYDKALELNSRFMLAYNNRGSAQIKKGNYDAAINDFTKAVELDPKYAHGYGNRAYAYLGKGDNDSAISDCVIAIGLEPKYADAYYLRGLAYAHKSEYGSAMDDYTKAIELEPQYTNAYVNRGRIYNDRGDYDHAISDYNKALESDPNDKIAYNNRGVAYFHKNEYDRAVDDHTKAIEQDPKFVLAYRNRADAYEKIGKSDLAAADRKKADQLEGK